MYFNNFKGKLQISPGMPNSQNIFSENVTGVLAQWLA